MKQKWILRMKTFFVRKVSCSILITLISIALPYRDLTAQGIGNSSVLYNGIKLPEVWPPGDLDPASVTPMRVPYLDAPPALIPINIGRQLFVDDFLVQETTLKRVFHQARKYEGNPVLFPETPEELRIDSKGNQEAVTATHHGGVFYDPAEKLFKMYYSIGFHGALGLAQSADLVNWTRPVLNMFGKNNIVLPKGINWAGLANSVWLDLNTKDPNARWKLITNRTTYPFGHSVKDYQQYTLHTSPDGLHWSHGVKTGKIEDYCSFFFNPFRNMWTFSLKANYPIRIRNYVESKDFLTTPNWENSTFWVGADELDEPDPNIGDTPQLYSLNSVAYESIMIGEFYIHLGPDNQKCIEGKFPKLTEIKLGFSRDGFHWHRPDRRAFIEATRKEGDWDRYYVYGTTGIFLVKDDLLWFPYTGYSGVSPNGSKGIYTGASVGMATLRRDGFASMEAGEKTGYLVTRPLTFNGKYLFVNVDCPDGELLVEALDGEGNVIRPFSLKQCKSTKVNKTLHQIEWEGQPDLSALAGKPVRFRFHLTNGKLYSFWVSPDLNGASYGYLAAGSPGHDGVVDTKGSDIISTKL